MPCSKPVYYNIINARRFGEISNLQNFKMLVEIGFFHGKCKRSKESKTRKKENNFVHNLLNFIGGHKCILIYSIHHREIFRNIYSFVIASLRDIQYTVQCTVGMVNLSDICKTMVAMVLSAFSRKKLRVLCAFTSICIPCGTTRNFAEL
jgi:hypothetical protein